MVVVHVLQTAHFTLLFCRGQQRNEPRVVTHVHSHCSAYWTLWVATLPFPVVVVSLNSLILCIRHFLFSRPVIYNFNLIMCSRITVLKQTLYRTRAIQVGLSINLEYELLKDLLVPKGFNLQSYKLENLASFLLSYQQTVSQFTRYRA